jgi:hypothetical protein
MEMVIKKPEGQIAGMPTRYSFNITDTVKRTEYVTLENLQKQKAMFQAKIDEIQAKIDAITNLPVDVPPEGIKVGG